MFEGVRIFGGLGLGVVVLIYTATTGVYDYTVGCIVTYDAMIM